MSKYFIIFLLLFLVFGQFFIALTVNAQTTYDEINWGGMETNIVNASPLCFGPTPIQIYTMVALVFVVIVVTAVVTIFIMKSKGANKK